MAGPAIPDNSQILLILNVYFLFEVLVLRFIYLFIHLFISVFIPLGDATTNEKKTRQVEDGIKDVSVISEGN